MYPSPFDDAKVPNEDLSAQVKGYPPRRFATLQRDVVGMPCATVTGMAHDSVGLSVELRKLRIYARLSEETTAFSADVWIDSKKAGYAKNDGHGGATIVQISDRAVAQQLRDHGAALVPAAYQAFCPGDEWVVDDLVVKAIEAKETARVAKKTAKVDAEVKSACASRGTHAARFKSDVQTTRWIEYRDEASGRLDASRRFGQLTEWTVIA